MSGVSLSSPPVPYPPYCNLKSLSEIFDSFDLDHNGSLSREELRVCLAMCGKPVSDSQLDMMISLADPDNDGIIRREDFIDFFQNPQKCFDRISSDRTAPPTSREGGFLPALTAEKLARMNPSTRRARMTDVVHALLGVSEIRPRDVKVLYKRFKELDTKKIGKLNLLQFSRLFEGSETAPGFKNQKARNSFINLLFSFCDRDKSGSVDTKEFITSLCHMASMGEVERLRFSFMLFDIDGDGFMDRQELIQLVSSIHLGLSESELGELVNKVDSILRIFASEGGAGGSSARLKWKDTKLTFDKLVKISADNPGLFNVFEES